MGCCGCDNKTSAKTAGIFSLIQSIIGLSLNCYFLSIYYADVVTSAQLFLLWKTRNYIGVIRGLLVASAIMQSIWLISSICLLLGNNMKHVYLIRQWVFITSMVIIADIIFPAIVIGATIRGIMETFSNHIVSYTDHPRFDETRIYHDYFLLIVSFSRGGIITLITNIALCIFTNQRAREILQPQTGYVVASDPMHSDQQMAFMSSANHPGYPQPGYPQPQIFLVQQQQQPGYTLQ